MKLPQPKVKPGDEVEILDQRYGRNMWEAGICTSAALGFSGSHDYQTLYLKWIYTVRLHRLSATRVKYGRERGNHPIFLRGEHIRASHN